ncbi:unnamed protein product (macronuclear) [Paramecium tetraurelia]|uniref:Uncharacterized protein n=1 Tax=Paramecium tetraurelia TaxID=5888 RepID=A0BY71_PARTE|nr:uncharacterized protein GSPATT00033341001 [Paramecium tetraurelia]CAK63488.1 unnamed protein product [Paramecium tetraurelia]|eukprot:XP_001430886.1 hypothetical protein (macronuclear) [Paramecium tetraurelia strain d4-2]
MKSDIGEPISRSPNQINHLVLLKKDQDGFRNDEFYQTTEACEYDLEVQQKGEVFILCQQSPHNSPLLLQNVCTDVQIFLILDVPIQFCEQIWNLISRIYDSPVENGQIGNHSQKLVTDKINTILSDYYDGKQLHLFFLNLLELLKRTISNTLKIDLCINFLQEDQHLQYLQKIYDHYQEYLKCKEQNDGFIWQNFYIELEQTILQSLESKLNKNSY